MYVQNAFNFAITMNIKNRLPKRPPVFIYNGLVNRLNVRSNITYRVKPSILVV